MHEVTIPVVEQSVDVVGNMDGSWGGGGGSGSAAFGGPNITVVSSSVVVTVHLLYDVTGHVPAGDNIAVTSGTLNFDLTSDADEVVGYQHSLGFSVNSHGENVYPPVSGVPVEVNIGTNTFTYSLTAGYSLPE